MKKLSIVLISLIVALAVAGLAFAQAKGKPAEPAKTAEPAKPAEAAKPEEAKKEAAVEPAKPAEPAKPEEAKKEAPKVVKYRIGGEVVALDAAARKITIKQDAVKKHKKITLTVGKKRAKDLAGISVGDVVNAWVTNKSITKITKIF